VATIYGFVKPYLVTTKSCFCRLQRPGRDAVQRHHAALRALKFLIDDRSAKRDFQALYKSSRSPSAGIVYPSITRSGMSAGIAARGPPHPDVRLGFRTRPDLPSATARNASAARYVALLHRPLVLRGAVITLAHAALPGLELIAASSGCCF